MVFNNKALLVGDNPFHSISHLSQDRTRLRDKNIVLPEHAADLILCAVNNGANGFMFSVSETTLSILRTLRKRELIARIGLYAIVPYAYEYVKMSTQVGGIPGLAQKVCWRMILSRNLKTMTTGLVGFLKSDPMPLLKTYLAYELSKMKSSAGKRCKIECLILHEVLTDLGLAMNLESLFKSYIEHVENFGIVPGFNTVNFAYLVERFNEWNIDVSKLAIVAPFNKVGFQMVPSREKCEQTLKGLGQPTLIAISVLAAGYLKPPEAVEYIASLPNVKGLAVGVSSEKHAQETFRLMKQKFAMNTEPGSGNSPKLY